ncbi:MAG TPA: hypothetical protein VE913_12585 [Longimicrobium sp.]|nr:hypothetical protein [Longimicrobium sp.]
MAQVHIAGTRYAPRQAAVTSAIQAYTGMGMIEARRLAANVIEGIPVTVPVDDPDNAYNLATELAALGVNAEADDGDY